ncbi:MAG: nickel-dependent lactate racemase [Planctomycetes bacterium]|nr:nickel-dependent lactate racemase [Planctomycetota bacterium]
MRLRVAERAVVYRTDYPPAAQDPRAAVAGALRHPQGAPPIRQALARRRPGPVVIAVCDATRPVPYKDILPPLLEQMRRAGVKSEEILILVATGMHRPTTPREQRRMLGPAAERYRVVNHDATDAAGLRRLTQDSWAGAPILLNRNFVEAGFRMVTGLVEPHFMAGFSGGRKTVCPGLAGLETIRHFHGRSFLDDPHARNGLLADNPLHAEALSIARAVGVDYALDVVLEQEHRIVRAFAGALEESHRAACDMVSRCACRPVKEPADLVITSSGGAPLDDTFYQCVKGFVSALGAVREGGVIVAVGGCAEGVGSPGYTELLKRYCGRWPEFLRGIRAPDFFVKDQWQFQAHTRALEKIGVENLHFVTPGLPADELALLSVTPHAVVPGELQAALQSLVDGLSEQAETVAVIPEGPYCAPISTE